MLHIYNFPFLILLGLCCPPPLACATEPKQSPLPAEFLEVASQKKGLRLPGLKPLSVKLTDELKTAYEKNKEQVGGSGDQKPPTYLNRLALEANPYLLQHATNPINWLPWGDQAFSLAKKLDRPIFLSIGYSTCHWCHVMEEESFRNVEIARELNQNYIAIKVDREERPDLDQHFIKVVETATGEAGWPMSLWLTPDKKVFFAGTYYPPKDGQRNYTVGLLSLLKRLAHGYHHEKDRLSLATSQLLKSLKRETLKLTPSENIPSIDSITKAYKYFKKRYDKNSGGLSGAPKFPLAFPNLFLLRYTHLTGMQSAQNMAINTLKKMQTSALFDGIGGGFHRYATDAKWSSPHYEKILSDNALMALTYAKAYQITGNDTFKDTATQTLEFVMTDLSAPEGGFYSSLDADSLDPSGKTQEGAYYTWSYKELKELLTPVQLKLMTHLYNFDLSNSSRNQRHPLHPVLSRKQLSKITNQEFSTVQNEVKNAFEKLQKARQSRPQPFTDKKVITAWNALTISAFAQAGFIFNNDKLIARAERAAQFLTNHLLLKGGLYRIFINGEQKQSAFLDDHVYLTASYLDLFSATHDLGWLKQAQKLTEIIEESFADTKQGGYWNKSSPTTGLKRSKPYQDDLVPSPNAVHAHNLWRLSLLTMEGKYLKRAQKTLRAFSKPLMKQPHKMTDMLFSLSLIHSTAQEIALIHPRQPDNNLNLLLAKLRRYYHPLSILAVVPSSELKNVKQLLPWVANKKPIKETTTAYVCTRGVCKLPTTNKETFYRQIKRSRATLLSQ